MNQSSLWTSKEIAEATNGQTLREFQASRVVIDSRQCVGGDLFIALQGPQFDGHDYVRQALEQGAAGAVVHKVPEGLEKAPLILVKDTKQSLQELGRYARQRTQARIIGLTGSFGKTSIKEALRHVLGRQKPTFANERSFNNHWGVPLTLSCLQPDHAYAVIEMGMNNPGEILDYTLMARPHVALITLIGDAHIGKLGSIEAIAAAKAEILEGVIEGGVALLNRATPCFDLLEKRAQERNLDILTFGEHPQADFQVIKTSLVSTGLEVQVSFKGHLETVRLNTFASYWGNNLAAVLASVHAIGGSWQQACQEMSSFHLLEGRGRVFTFPVQQSFFTVLDESYNAAPTAMKKAIETLTRIPISGKGRRIAILGDMLELGDQSQKIHEEMAQTLQAYPIDLVYCCGQEMRFLFNALPKEMQGGYATDPTALVTQVVQNVTPNDIYLVKGSRGQWAARGRMAAFIDAFKALQRSDQQEKAG